MARLPDGIQPVTPSPNGCHQCDEQDPSRLDVCDACQRTFCAQHWYEHECPHGDFHVCPGVNELTTEPDGIMTCQDVVDMIRAGGWRHVCLYGEHVPWIREQLEACTKPAIHVYAQKVPIEISDLLVYINVPQSQSLPALKRGQSLRVYVSYR